MDLETGINKPTPHTANPPVRARPYGLLLQIHHQTAGLVADDTVHAGVGLHGFDAGRTLST